MLPLARHELDRSARQVDTRSVGLLSTYSWRATVFPPPPWHATSLPRKIETVRPLRAGSKPCLRSPRGLHSDPIQTCPSSPLEAEEFKTA